jgi:LysM repeat protein
MDRKKTIIIAAVINAGLLAVLFIAAMTMQEESLPQTEFVHTLGNRVEAPKPLFNERVEVPAAPATLAALPVVEAPQAPLPIRTEEPVVHHLPPVAAERSAPTPMAPLVSAAPVAALRPTEISVERGDSLEKLAKKHNTSVDELIKLNQLPSSFLKVGQKLKIPFSQTGSPIAKETKAAPAAPIVADQAEYYTMKVGDNPWSIAMKHHLKVNELLKMNGLNEEKARKLKPGDRLRIR